MPKRLGNLIRGTVGRLEGIRSPHCIGGALNARVHSRGFIGSFACSVERSKWRDGIEACVASARVLAASPMCCPPTMTDLRLSSGPTCRHVRALLASSARGRRGHAVGGCAGARCSTPAVARKANGEAGEQGQSERAARGCEVGVVASRVAGARADCVGPLRIALAIRSCLPPSALLRCPVCGIG